MEDLYNTYKHTLCLLEDVSDPYTVYILYILEHVYTAYSGGCVQYVHSLHCVFWRMYTIRKCINSLFYKIRTIRTQCRHCTFWRMCIIRTKCRQFTFWMVCTIRTQCTLRIWRICTFRTQCTFRSMCRIFTSVHCVF